MITRDCARISDVECPSYADYFDTRHYSNGAQQHVPRTICLFEKGAATPLRRHFEEASHDYDYDDTDADTASRTWRKRLVQV